MNESRFEFKVEPTRVYGNGGGRAYRAVVYEPAHEEPIAVAKTKAQAETEAIRTMYSAYRVSGNPPAMAATQDGRVIIGTEVNQDTFAIWYFVAGERQISSAMCNPTINGKRVTLAQMVRYYALMANGTDAFDAADEIMREGK